MKKVLLALLRLGIVLGVFMAAIQILRPKLGGIMARCFQEMPEESLPKWMYNNIAAIREQNERIIELLDKPEKAETVKESA